MIDIKKAKKSEYIHGYNKIAQVVDCWFDGINIKNDNAVSAIYQAASDIYGQLFEHDQQIVCHERDVKSSYDALVMLLSTITKHYKDTVGITELVHNVQYCIANILTITNTEYIAQGTAQDHAPDIFPLVVDYCSFNILCDTITLNLGQIGINLEDSA